MFTCCILASAFLTQPAQPIAAQTEQSFAQEQKLKAPLPQSREVQKLWLDARALYMRATEDGLDIAFQNKVAGQTDPTGDPLVQGPLITLPYDWDWGCRLSAGLPLAHENWDISAYWTWFQTHGAKHQNQGVFYPIALNGGSTPGSSFKSHAHLHINLAGLELGRTFQGERWGYFRPHFGIAAAWVHRKWTTEYKGINNPEHPGIHEDQSVWNCQYQGAGLRGAWDIGLYMFRGWSIVNQAGLSYLYVEQKTSQIDEPTFNGEQFTGGKVTNGWHTLRAIGEFSLGLR